MRLFNINISSDRLFRLLFHLLFWSLLLGFPFLNSMGNEDYSRYIRKTFPAALAYVPLFFLITEFLTPKIFRKKGVGAFFLSLIPLIAAFIFLQLFLREWLVHNKIDFHFRQRSIWFTSIIVLMVAAVATAYSLITSMVSQEKARQEERQERLQSELSFLRSQISPHFIFNILNGIVYLIRSGSKLAEPVTIKLSELMRYALYQSADDQVPLSQELDYLENYIDLQKIRFGEDVDIRLNTQGNAQGQIIEPMLLIPFVENAFKHGVGMVIDPIIDITVQFDEKKLFFEVKNKIGPEGAEDKDFSSGIGLRNVVRRLELLYPGRHDLDIIPSEEWFKVKLQLNFT